FAVHVVPVITEYPMLKLIKDGELEACLCWCSRADSLVIFVPNWTVKDGSCMSSSNLIKCPLTDKFDGCCHSQRAVPPDKQRQAYW
ncbi:hypothetical protein BD309DRAFT_874066, partial [Dichomitus squalens]